VGGLRWWCRRGLGHQPRDGPNHPLRGAPTLRLDGLRAEAPLQHGRWQPWRVVWSLAPPPEHSLPAAGQLAPAAVHLLPAAEQSAPAALALVPG